MAERRPYDPDNVFARILRRELPARILHEDEHCIAFHDVAPQAPTHFLVVPREPLAQLADATEQHAPMLGHLLVVAARLCRELGLAAGGFRTVINSGASASQTVFHLHVHVLAGRPLGWPPG